jgi:hypothetical protein
MVRIADSLCQFYVAATMTGRSDSLFGPDTIPAWANMSIQVLICKHRPEFVLNFDFCLTHERVVGYAPATKLALIRADDVGEKRSYPSRFLIESP